MAPESFSIRIPAVLLGGCLILSGWIHGQDQGPSEVDPSVAKDILPLFETYCGNCHAGPEPEAEFDLLSLASRAQVGADPDTWHLVADRLRALEMPPPRSPSPTEQERTRLVTWIEQELELAPGSRSVEAQPGSPTRRTVLRRLTRFEIENSVLDVLGLSIDATRSLPLDEAADGFDTIGSALTFSDAHLAGIFDFAEEVSRRAVPWVDPEEVLEHVLEAKRFETEQRVSRGSVLGFTTNGSATAALDLAGGGDFRADLFAKASRAGNGYAQMELRIDDERIATFEVKEQGPGFAKHTTRVTLTPGAHRIGVAFINDFYAPENKNPKRRDRNLYVEKMILTGPLDVPSARTTGSAPLFGLGKRAEEDLGAVARDLAEAFWRRPPSPADLQRLLSLSLASDPKPLALRSILVGILVSPRFLFRLERQPLGAESRQLDGYELATRLAGFLWSSLPDEELRQRAARGTLASGDQLAQEARRMIADARSTRLVTGFGMQWLQLRPLEFFSPDPKRYPSFDPELRGLMLRETELLFETVLREQRPIADLIDPDFTFLNQRLAEHYGIAGVEGPLMRRVPLRDGRRGGLLSQASVLTATSYPTRTSPALRGKWILEVLLGDAPPPPPPDVPPLSKSAAEGGPLSLRASFEEHRKNPACAACHDQMDPLGFGLENYDVIGSWRAQDRGQELDVQGLLPTGESFQGPVELKALLSSDPRWTVHLTERLMVYALGRSLSATDRAQARSIAAEVDPRETSLLDIIENIVRSSAFRTLQADPDGNDGVTQR